MKYCVAACFAALLFLSNLSSLRAQQDSTVAPSPSAAPDFGQIQGNFQAVFQTYNQDSAISAVVPPEQSTLNAFTNLIYTRGKFSAGMRYESYLPRQVGYPGRFAGSGIGYRYASYTMDELSVTIGNFYDQFGQGLVFRSYEERNLGLDNAMDGIKVAYQVMPGFVVKGVYGKMRFNFNDGLINTDSYVRGIDGEINLNELITKFNESSTSITIGGSFVSKYQRDYRSDLVLPENVGAWAGRFNLYRGNFGMSAEYAYKINDPSADNKYIYHDGQALLVNMNYTTKGFSLNLDGKTIDNMSYRPDRTLQITDAMINYLPAMTTQHTYLLAGTFYPYATQPLGEVAYQAEVGYKVKKNTKLGGKYGMDILVSSSQAYAPDKEVVNDLETTRLGYTNNLFGTGDQLYYADFNATVKRKFSKKFNATAIYYNFVYNNDVIAGASQLNVEEVVGTVYADVFVLDMNIKTKDKHNLNLVAQYLSSDQHQGDWASLQAEYSISPHWIFAILNMYNFGNDIKDDRLHYPFGSVTYVKNANRISMEYGKRRAGIFCVGGVCRPVPASNGLTVTITSSF